MENYSGVDIIAAEQNSQRQTQLNHASSLRAIAHLINKENALAERIVALPPADLFGEDTAISCAGYVASVTEAAENRHAESLRAAISGMVNIQGHRDPDRLREYCTYQAALTAAQALLKIKNTGDNAYASAQAFNVAYSLLFAREYSATRSAAAAIIPPLASAYNSVRYTLEGREQGAALQVEDEGRRSAPAVAQSVVQQTRPLDKLSQTQTVRFRHGVARQTRGEPIAPFRIKTEAGTNYAFKITRASDDSEQAFGFVEGGRLLDIKMPLGAFNLRHCAGPYWISERELFGDKTSCSKAASPLSFARDGDRVRGVEVELILQRNGNLKTDPIDKLRF